MEHLIEIYREWYLFDFSNNWIFLSLLGVILLDNTLGILDSLVNHTFKSKESINGIIRNIVLIGCLLLVYPLVVDFGFSQPISGFMLLIVFTKLLSIIKKWESMGGYVPSKIKEYITKQVDE